MAPQPPTPRELAPCGSPAARRRHRRHDETCPACGPPPRPGRPVSQPHGTSAAVRRHEYHHEKCCPECLPVQREHNIARRAKARDRTARDSAGHTGQAS